MTTKIVWGVIKGSRLWVQFTKKKHFCYETIVDWIRNPIKKLQNDSIFWKYILDVFPLIGNWMIWKIGDGAQVLIEKDPWIGYKENHIIPYHLFHDIYRNGSYYLNQLVSRVQETRHLWWLS